MNKRPMRILHVYKDYFPILGGIENHIKTLAVAQAAAGHQVKVLVTNPGDEQARTVMDGVELVRVWRLATLASTPLSPTFPLALRRERPQLTHLHFPYPVGELSQLLVGSGRPYVISYHSDVVRQKAILRWYRPFLNRVLNGAARILAGSENYIHSSPYLRPLMAKCNVVPYSVEIEPFRRAEPLFPPGPVPTLLFVGRHRYYKGVDDLIRAMPGLEAHLLIGGDGPMRPAWQKVAAKMDVAEKVSFVGQVSDADLPRLYASADIFVLPANARAEAFGKVLLEAMAAGLPCVTTELGTGTSYVVQDGVSGLVVAPRRPEALTEALGRLLADSALRHRMGQAGRDRVAREFTTQQMVSRVQGIYQQVLGEDCAT